MDVSWVFHRVLSSAVTLTLALSPCLSYAAPPQEQLGVLVEFAWNVGDVHPDQSRWQTNFALGPSSNIVRLMYETDSINASVGASFENKYFAGYSGERSLLPLQWSTDSMGKSLGMLYGVPVVTKFSPVFNASGSNTGSGLTIVSNPWVWVGAAVVGLAAAAGGGGGGDSSGGPGGQGCDVVGGNIGSDPDVVIVSEGCENNGTTPTSVDPQEP